MVTKEYAQQILKKYKDALMATPGVVSVGLTRIGENYVISVRVSADVALPKEIEGVPVLVTKQARPPGVLAGYTGRYRPVPMGVSIGTKEYDFTNPFTRSEIHGAPTGSSGFYVAGWQGTFLITSAHLWWYAVLAAWQKKYGKKLTPWELGQLPPPDVAGEICVQPGYADGGRETDRIGVLSKYTLLPIGPPGIDGSAVRLDTKSLALDALPDGNKVSGTAEPEIGEKVFMIGRTTGISEGVIRETDADVRLYSPLDAYDAAVGEAFIVEMHSSQGDSGGPILNGRNELVGICSAGDGAFTTVGTRADRILEALKIRPPYQIAIPGFSLLFVGLGLFALSRANLRR